MLLKNNKLRIRTTKSLGWWFIQHILMIGYSRAGCTAWLHIDAVSLMTSRLAVFNQVGMPGIQSGRVPSVAWGTL